MKMTQQDIGNVLTADNDCRCDYYLPNKKRNCKLTASFRGKCILHYGKENKLPSEDGEQDNDNGYS